MKKNLFLRSVWMGMLALAFVLTACSDDDDPTGLPGQEPGQEQEQVAPQAVLKTFAREFPDAANVTWKEVARLGSVYYVASFDRTQQGRSLDEKAHQAWFLEDGTMSLSEMELPAAVLEKDAAYAEIWLAWQTTDFFRQGFRIDEVEVLCRLGFKEKIVKLEIEKGREEFDLFFTFSGTLVKVVADKDDADDDEEDALAPNFGNLPCPAQVLKFLEAKYPDAVLVDVEKDLDDGVVQYEVTILTKFLDMDVEKELVFDVHFDYLYAEIDLDDRVVAGWVIHFLTKEQLAQLQELTGEMNPADWDFEIIENREGLLTVYVEDRNEERVELVKDFDPSQLKF